MTHNTGAKNLILEKFSALGAPLSNSPPLYLLYSLYLNPSLAPLPKIPILQIFHYFLQHQYPYQIYKNRSHSVIARRIHHICISTPLKSSQHYIPIFNLIKLSQQLAQSFCTPKSYLQIGNLPNSTNQTSIG